MPNLPKPKLRRAAGAGSSSGRPAGRAGEAEREPDRCRGAALGERRAPGAVERDWLEANFDFHALDLEDVLSRNQRPKIDEYADYLFIVLHFPVVDPRSGGSGPASSTSCRPRLPDHTPNQPCTPSSTCSSVAAQRRMPEQSSRGGSGNPLYRLVDDSFDDCFPMLRKIGNKLDALADEIFEGRSRGGRARHLQRQAGDHQLPQDDPAAAPVLRDLERQAALPGARPTSRSTSTTSSTPERIWDMLENDKEVAEALEYTNESVISHRVNDILRVLTSISVIVLPLTLIASIWGMTWASPARATTTDFYVDRRRHAGHAVSSWSPSSTAAARS